MCSRNIFYIQDLPLPKSDHALLVRSPWPGRNGETEFFSTVSYFLIEHLPALYTGEMSSMDAKSSVGLRAHESCIHS